MKFVFILVGFSLFFGSVQTDSFAVSGNRDTLLFDGAENINLNFDDDCGVEVVSSGTVEAMVRVKVKAIGCGVGPEDSVYAWQRKQTKTGDVIKADEEIITGPDGFIKLNLVDGSVILLNNNSRLKIDKEVCKKPGKISLLFGRIWTKIRLALGEGKYEVVTERIGGGVRGTEFTVDSDDKRDVVKVYEGSVEVNPRKVVLDKIYKAKEEEVIRLNQDFQDGKITMEEYMQKTAVQTEEMKKILDYSSIIVDAGFRCTIDSDGNISGAVPIESGDDKWFESFIK